MLQNSILSSRRNYAQSFCAHYPDTSTRPNSRRFDGRLSTKCSSATHFQNKKFQQTNWYTILCGLHFTNHCPAIWNYQSLSRVLEASIQVALIRRLMLLTPAILLKHGQKWPLWFRDSSKAKISLIYQIIYKEANLFTNINYSQKIVHNNHKKKTNYWGPLEFM